MKPAPVVALAVTALLACNRGKDSGVAAAPSGDLQPVMAEVARVRKDLDRIQDAVVAEPGQAKLTLDALATLELKPAARPVYAAWIAHLPPETAIGLVAFGIHSERLAAQVDRLVDQGRKDLPALERRAEAARFAVRVQAGDQASGTPAGAEVVEIGPAICSPGGKPTAGRCPGTPWGFLWRRDTGSAWFKGPLADLTPGTASFAADRLLPLMPTAVFQTAGGAEPSLAQLRHKRALADLTEELAAVIELGKQLEQELARLKAGG